MQVRAQVRGAPATQAIMALLLSAPRIRAFNAIVSAPLATNPWFVSRAWQARQILAQAKVVLATQDTMALLLLAPRIRAFNAIVSVLLAIKL